MKLLKIIGIVLLILFICYLVYGISLGIYTSSKCKSGCKERGTIFYQLERSGNLDLDDACICYFPIKNEIEVFMIK